MNILEQLAHVGSELPVVETAETKPVLPEITTQAQLDDILASHEQDEPLGLQFFPETCVHTLAVGEQVYVVNEFEASASCFATIRNPQKRHEEFPTSVRKGYAWRGGHTLW